MGRSRSTAACFLAAFLAAYLDWGGEDVLGDAASLTGELAGPG